MNTAPESGYDDLSRLASLIFETPIAFVAFVDEEHDYVKSCIGVAARELPARMSLCEQVVSAGEVVFSKSAAFDVPNDGMGAGLRIGDRPVRFCAGAPLLTAAGHGLGALCVLDFVSRPPPSPHQLYALEVLAGQVMAQVRLRRHSADLLSANESLREFAESAIASQGRLRQLAERLTKIFASTPVAIAMLSTAEKRFIEVNERFCSLTGYRPEELLQRPSASLALWRAAKEGEPSVETMLEEGSRRDVEIVLSTAQGKLRSALASFELLDFGAELSHLVVLQDITARRELERIKDDFVAIVSHELRTPLTAVHGAVALLLQRYPDPVPGERQELLRIAANNAERLSRLVNDILDIERMEAGKDELLLEKVIAADLLSEVSHSLSGLAATRRIELAVGADPGAIVLADRERLVQVLTNLVGNAIKFSPSDARVDLEARTAGGPRIRFSVSDRGPGIPLDVQDRIFEKFERLSEGRTKGGTGLGLAIAKAIVERHDGRIGLESSPGQGARFWFEIGAGGTP